MHTITADNKQRVRIPDTEPGQVFAYEAQAGKITLTLVKPVEPDPIKGRLEKRGKRLVGATDHALDMEALKAALAEFP